VGSFSSSSIFLKSARYYSLRSSDEGCFVKSKEKLVNFSSGFLRGLGAPTSPDFYLPMWIKMQNAI